MILLGFLCWYSPGRAEVTLPAALAEIGDEAFAGCGAMNEVSVPESVTVIGEGAFSDCGEALLILTEAGSEAVSYARGHQVDYRAGMGQKVPGTKCPILTVGEMPASIPHKEEGQWNGRAGDCGSWL